jgi:hypothetical protein
MSLSKLPPGAEVGIAHLDTYAGLQIAAHPNVVMHAYPKDPLMLADWERRVSFADTQHSHLTACIGLPRREPEPGRKLAIGL